MSQITIKLGDSLEVLKTYPDNHFDSVVTDAPYGLGKEPDALKLLQDWIDHGYHEIKGKGFMGKNWDAFVPQPILWKEVFRVLKPGGYLLCFFGTRTYDWGTMAIRLAGFEIRDMITWHYGSGFPKSLDVSKAIDKAAGAEREKIGIGKAGSGMNPVKGFGKNTIKNKIVKCCKNCSLELTLSSNPEYKYECISCDEDFYEFEAVENEVFITPKKEWDVTSAYTPEAKKYEGWGTALKPATEPICVARKPLCGTVAQNMIVNGTGGINIDACRIEFESEKDLKSATFGTGTNIIGGNYVGSKLTDGRKDIEANASGRFPANVILDPFMAGVMDEQTGVLTSGKAKPTSGKHTSNIYGSYAANVIDINNIYADSGGASRFFYCAKASQDERNAGCEHIATTTTTDGRNVTCDNAFQRGETERNNNHPTVKPISLMRWLQRLVTPVGGLTLDLFAGSGTSGCSAAFEGFDIVLIEGEEEYIPIIKARTTHWQKVANREKYITDLKNSQTSLFSA